MSLRYRLRYSWSPFFSRFGTLLPVQLETIPKILDGSNVVIMSPTASGKTEAVIAPVAEKCVMEQWQGLSILYIVPTRALANDTFQRIQGPLLDMNLTTAIKHQDTPYLSYKNLPNLLITTPESLDSLICRHSQIFSTLKTVILDEIHLLDNTYRGDQLRLLLWRLQKLANEGDLSIHLLSATLAYPHQVAKRYVKNFEVIEIKGQRVIDYHLFSSLSAVFEWVRRERWKKVLCFCNLRDSVESVAHELAELWHPYPVVVHHGSLHRREREEAEKVMKDSNVAVCVSTSTLEIGIDIGDIDLILLIEPPWSISSMIQRIGRGNRRENVARVAAIFKSNEEKSLLETMFNFAISGALDEAVYTPDRSVAIQQIFSFLFQNPKGMPES
jgi:ATP-dependent Lhr-like helicase